MRPIFVENNQIAYNPRSACKFNGYITSPTRFSCLYHKAYRNKLVDAVLYITNKDESSLANLR